MNDAPEIILSDLRNGKGKEEEIKSIVASKWEEKTFPLGDVVKRGSTVLFYTLNSFTEYDLSCSPQFFSRSSLTSRRLLEPNPSSESYKTSPSTSLEREDKQEISFVKVSKHSGRSSSRTQQKDRKPRRRRQPWSVGMSSTTRYFPDSRRRLIGSR